MKERRTGLNCGIDINKVKEMFDTEHVEDVRKIAVYVRESSKYQAKEGYNIHAQTDKCLDYVKCMLGTKEEDTMIYKEKGYSAKTTDRPKMNKMVEDIKSGKIKTVVVQKLDRLVRRNIGLATMLELFEEYDVRLITLRENIDTSNSLWKMVIYFYIMIAEIEQDQISERTTEALVYGAEHGSYIKGGNPPFGTCKEKIYNENDGSHIIALNRHPWQWGVLEKIYDLAYHGANCKEISLTISSLPIMRDYNKSLSDDSINDILSNPIYKGMMRFKGKEYRIDFEGCLDEKYWDQVQINRSVHLKGSPVNEYLYHGKVFCGCGTQCVVDVSNKRLADGTLKKYKYYVCPKCGKRVSETSVFEQVEPALVKHYETVVNDEYKEKQKQKILRLIDLKDEMHLMYINGDIDKKMYIEQLQRAQQTIEKVQNRISKKNKKFEKMDVRERQEWIDNVVKSIDIDMVHKKAKVKLKV